MFAVIKTGGKQYSVSADDQIRVESLAGEAGDMVEINEVLMVGNTVGVTLDGGDGPILFWSGFGFLFTCAFGVWATLDFPGLP